MTNTDTKQDELRQQIDDRLGELLDLGVEWDDTTDYPMREHDKATNDVMQLIDQYATTLAERKAKEARINELETHGGQWEAWQDEPDEMVKVSRVINWYKARIEELKSPKQEENHYERT